MSDLDGLLASMGRHRDVQAMHISDRDYAALKRRKLLRSIYSIAVDGEPDKQRFFFLTEAGASLAGSEPPPVREIPRVALKLRARSPNPLPKDQ